MYTQIADPTNVVGKRIGARIIDNVTYSVIIGVGYGIPFATGMTYYDAYYDTEELTDEGAVVVGFFFLICLAWVLFNEVFLQVSKGQTVGKMATGIRVVDYSTGEPPTVGRAFLRLVGSIPDFACCYGLIGLILVATVDHHRRVGDLAARTVVIDKNAVWSGVMAPAPGLGVVAPYGYSPQGMAPMGQMGPMGPMGPPAMAPMGPMGPPAMGPMGPPAMGPMGPPAMGPPAMGPMGFGPPPFQPAPESVSSFGPVPGTAPPAQPAVPPPAWDPPAPQAKVNFPPPPAPGYGTIPEASAGNASQEIGSGAGNAESTIHGDSINDHPPAPRGPGMPPVPPSGAIRPPEPPS